MREIKFRGIPVNKDDEHIDTVLDSIAFYEGDEFYDGTFIYGHLNGEYILGKTIETTEEYYRASYWIEVDENTIGQYTGLKDKNGKEIYEGDIVEYRDFSGGLLLFKEQPKSRCVIGVKDILKGIYCKGMGSIEKHKVEVIGNIYENKELLEAE